MSRFRVSSAPAANHTSAATAAETAPTLAPPAVINTFPFREHLAAAPAAAPAAAHAPTTLVYEPIFLAGRGMEEYDRAQYRPASTAGQAAASPALRQVYAEILADSPSWNHGSVTGPSLADIGKGLGKVAKAAGQASNAIEQNKEKYAESKEKSKAIADGVKSIAGAFGLDGKKTKK